LKKTKDRNLKCQKLKMHKSHLWGQQVKKIVNATKFNKKMEKTDGFFIKTNLLGNRHVTDGVIWTVDETEFNAE